MPAVEVEMRRRRQPGCRSRGRTCPRRRSAKRRLLRSGLQTHTEASAVAVAGDLYDPAWIVGHHREISGADAALMRWLAVLKIWGDADGVSDGETESRPDHAPASFDPRGDCEAHSGRVPPRRQGVLAVPHRQQRTILLRCAGTCSSCDSTRSNGNSQPPRLRTTPRPQGTRRPARLFLRIGLSGPPPHQRPPTNQVVLSLLHGRTSFRR